MKRPHLVVEGNMGNFEEFKEGYPEFCEKITEFDSFGSNSWAFVVNYGDQFDKTSQGSDLMDFLIEHYIELAYLRENHAVEMSAVSYISDSHPAGMISFEPETIGFCAGLSIQLQIIPA